MAAVDQKKESYLDPLVLERIKRLDVRARSVVEGFLSGMHKSPYHGLAVEFAGHREYAPGDELKHIDWKVWSKTDRLYIKEYEEETNLRCTLVVDASKSMGYPLGSWSKYDYAATAAASLAHLLHSQQDAAGLVTFNSRIVDQLPARSRVGHVKQITHLLDQLEPDKSTDVGQAFMELAPRIGRRGIVVIFSDLFVDEKLLRHAFQQFRLRNHEVVVFHIMHDDELKFPFEDNTRFVGLEEDERIQLDPRALRKTYLDEVDKYRNEVQRTCGSLGIDYRLVNTSQPLDAVLAGYLGFRNKTIRGRI